MMRRPRPSSIPAVCCLDEGDVTPEYPCFSNSHEHKPNPEWYITEDGVEFGVGDKVYDYYDGRWVVVVSDPAKDKSSGWFDTETLDGKRAGYLNSVRVASKER